MHVGGVRTALFNYLYAKQNGGQFILRLEDTDRERFVEDGVKQIVESLKWLGLEPDEGFWISEGKHQNIDFIQSQRHKNGVYQKYVDRLLEEGTAYRDWSTPKELAAYREQAQKNKRPFIFRKSMAKTDGDQSQPHVIRLNVLARQEQAKKEVVEWEEAVRGKLQTGYQIIDDFIIIKSDSFPTYNFANVIDDHEMNVSHVLRGDEFIASTAKHLLLYEALELNKPEFIHLPVINGLDGKKLSKRTGDTDVLDYQAKGYLPEALLNFLALLGWNDGTEQEIFSPEELQQKFKLEQINTSPAVFDQKRLDWISGHHIRGMALDKLYERSAEFWSKAAEEYDEDYKKQVLGLVQERLKFFAELDELTEFFFKDLPVNPSLLSEHKKLKKMTHDELKSLLTQAKQTLEDSSFETEDLKERLNQLLETSDQKPVILFSLIRIATTQATASPELAPTLSVLGKERSLKRIDEQIAQLT
jgi:glutamyl-tRNA synthetase